MSDPGLQLERTRLAWTRTALTAAAFAGVALKAGVSQHEVADLVAAGSAAAAGVAFYLNGHLHRVVPPATVVRPAGVVMRFAVAACLCSGISTLVANLV